MRRIYKGMSFYWLVRAALVGGPLGLGLYLVRRKARKEVNVNLSRIFRRAGVQRGQTLVEYGLIIALIAVALIIALQLLAGGIENVFCDVREAMTGGEC